MWLSSEIRPLNSYVVQLVEHSETDNSNEIPDFSVFPLQTVANLLQIVDWSVLQVRIVIPIMQILHTLLFQLADLFPPFLKLDPVGFWTLAVVPNDYSIDYLVRNLFGGTNKLFKSDAKTLHKSFAFSEHNIFYDSALGSAYT